MESRAPAPGATATTATSNFEFLKEHFWISFNKGQTFATA